MCINERFDQTHAHPLAPRRRDPCIFRGHWSGFSHANADDDRYTPLRMQRLEENPDQGSSYEDNNAVRIKNIRKVRWIGCSMCGSSETVSTSTRLDHEAASCSSGCELEFWSNHADWQLERNPSNSSWSYMAKCLATSQLFHGDAMATGATTTPHRDEDAEAIRSMFERLEKLKDTVSSLYANVCSSSSANNARCCETLGTWLEEFDRFMRNLDGLHSRDFGGDLLSRTSELHHPAMAPPPESEAKAQYDEVKSVLRELVRVMPMNRLLYEHKELLRSVLGYEKYGDDRMVLALDGGGMKGIVTLVVMTALRDRLRKRTGVPDLKIDDCFDLVIGTSTGGIIVTGMCAAEMDLEILADMYGTMGKKVFSEENKCKSKLIGYTCKYADDTMFEILMGIFGTRRLDDPETSFSDSDRRGPRGVRFGVTAVDIATSRSRKVLLRNYERLASECCPEDMLKEAWIEGTDQCYIAEAVMCTTSAQTFLHPYARFYAPLQVTYNVWVGNSTTKYRAREGSMGKHLYTHTDIILDACGDAGSRKIHEEKMKGDSMMEGDAVFVDGGAFANNPSMVALCEARRLWSGKGPCCIHMVSIGTGVVPVTKNPTWSKAVPAPATLGIMGEHTAMDAVSDLVMYSMVAPLCETEDTAKLIQAFGTLQCSIKRINPNLSRTIAMDDSSDKALEDLRRSALAYCESKEGSEYLDSTADEILANSSRLHRMVMTPKKK